jgi:hypothetical protein
VEGEGSILYMPVVRRVIDARGGTGVAGGMVSILRFFIVCSTWFEMP